VPGVVVTTQTQLGPSASTKAQSGQFFIAGLTERGDVSAPVLVRGMADVANLLGSRVSYGAVWDQLNTFFSEGGLQAYVARVVGGSATVGNLTLVDRAGSPQNTLRIDAQNPGSWSTQISVQVQNGSVANTFRITVYLNGIAVEDKNNLASPGDAVTAFSKSVYVRATDLGSVTASPNNNPAVISATTLSSGADDRASVVAATYVAALSRFTPALGDGSVAIPGQTSTAIWTGIDAHCRANNRIGLLASAQGDSKATLLGRVVEVSSEYCGIFSPWVKVPDGSGNTRTISPEGYVAACRARAHSQVGPWRVPAGAIAAANFVSDLDQKFIDSDANDLDAGRVNVIKLVAGTVRLYGWRSLSPSSDYTYLKDRDLLNYLTVQANILLENYVFQTIDRKGQLQSAVAASLTGLVDPIAQGGGLYPFVNDAGQQVDPGYKVETGDTVNTPSTLAQNILNARLSVRISPVGSLISLVIVKVGVLSGM
jgi:hypothetical protein